MGKIISVNGIENIRMGELQPTSLPFSWSLTQQMFSVGAHIGRSKSYLGRAIAESVRNSEGKSPLRLLELRRVEMPVDSVANRGLRSGIVRRQSHRKAFSPSAYGSRRKSLSAGSVTKTLASRDWTDAPYGCGEFRGDWQLDYWLNRFLDGLHVCY